MFKKIVVGIVVILLGIYLLNEALNRIVSLLPDPCGEKWLSEVVSPDQKKKAVVFEYDCGATTDFSTQVSILDLNSSSKETGRSIFSADTDHGSAPKGAGGGPEVRVRWLSHTQLEIQVHMFAHVTRFEPREQDVDIVYGRFQ